MTSSKSVSWSALINIGNNESLALTVTGEAVTPDEARDIFAFGIGQLIGTANSADEPTAALIRAYVARLVQEEEAKPAVQCEKTPVVKRIEPKITKAEWDAMQEAKAKRTSRPPTVDEQAAEAVARCVKPPAPTPDPTLSAPPQPEASAPAERPAAPQSTASAPDSEVCEVCGAPVPLHQAKLSQLFMSKTLCKTCMDSNGGPK